MRKILTLLAVLVMAGIISVALPDDAAAALPDSDGYVPEYYYCGNYDGKLAVYRYRYNYYYSGGRLYTYNVRGYILYDSCEMRAKGAGYNDWLRVIRHERAHARGWDHYEGSPRYNPAYYPRITIRGY